MHIPYHTASDEYVLHTRQVGVFQFVEDDYVVEFDVQVLVDGLEGATNGDVVFQFDGDGLLG